MNVVSQIAERVLDHLFGNVWVGFHQGVIERPAHVVVLRLAIVGDIHAFDPGDEPAPGAFRRANFTVFTFTFEAKAATLKVALRGQIAKIFNAHGHG
jgi:hypothetical protein